MVYPATSRIELPEVAPSFDAERSHHLVSEITDSCRACIQHLEVVHHTEHIDDGLGQNSRNGGAPNVMQDDRHIRKSAANGLGLFLESCFPIGTVRYNRY